MKDSRILGRLVGMLAVVVTAQLLLAGGAFAAIGDIPDSPLTADTDGTVSSLAVSGNTLFVGGSFARIGDRTGSLVSTTSSTGALEPGRLPAVTGRTGEISSVIGDGTGGWYIGGGFTRVGGAERIGLAHVLADGTVDPSFQADLDASGDVSSLLLSGSTLYVSGSFSSIGGQTRSNLAALDATTGAPTGWHPDPDDFVSAMALSDDGSTLYVTGSFTQIGQTSPPARARLAAVSTSTGNATSWDPNPTSSGGGGVFLNALAVDGSTVYVAGRFESIGETPAARHDIAAIDATTGNPSAWNPNPVNTADPDFSEVDQVVVSGSTVYIGGTFDQVGQTTTVERHNLAALSASSGNASSWSPNPDGDVFYMTLSGSLVYVGGDFTHIGQSSQVTRHFMAAVDSTTGNATAWNPDPNSENSGDIAVSGSHVVLGGSFTSLGGFDRNGLAAIDLTTGQVTSWDPHLTSSGFQEGDVQSLAVSGSTLYASGGFTEVGGQPRQFLAAIDTTSGTATPWNPNPDNSVTALAVAGGHVYAAGFFNHIGANSQLRNGFAALDPATGNATSWDPNPNNDIFTLVASGSKLYAAGSFTQIGPAASARNHAASFDAASGAVTPWDPSPDGSSLSSLTVDGSTVYLVGDFDHVQGIAHQNIAAVNDTTGAPTAWNPTVSTAPDSVAVTGGNVYIGGQFNTVNGTTRNTFAAIDASTGALTSWNPNAAQSDVFALVAGPAGSLFAAGNFSNLEVAPNSGLALWGVPVPASSQAPPPPAPPSSTARKPHVRINGRHRQRILKQGGLVLAGATGPNGTLRFSATVSVPSLAKVLRFKVVRKTVKAWTRVKIKLRFSHRNLALVRRALRDHKRLIANVRLTSTSTGNLSSTTSLRIRLLR